MRIDAYRRGLVALVVPLLGGLVGCSTFKSSRHLDMGPFAENTVAMLVDAQKTVQPFEWHYLRQYREGAMADSMQAEADLVRNVFRGIGFYSIEVVALNQARISNRERAARLANYIGEASQPIVSEGGLGEYGITQAKLDSVLANIRAQTTYLDAIGAAHPLVYSIVTFTIARVDTVAAKVQPAFDFIQSEVSASFRGIHAEIVELNQLEEENVRNYLFLQEHRVGKPGALDSLLSRDPSMADVLTPKNRNSAAAIDEAQRVLQERLASIDSVRGQLDMRNLQHAHQLAELDEMRNEMDQRVRTARLTLIYWLRSHGSLAQGVVVPPAINVSQIVGSTAKRALKSFP